MRASSHWLKRFWLLAAGVAVLLPAAWAAGQDNGRTVYDEQLRLRLDEQVAAAREIGLDAGGWFSFAVFNYNDTTVRKTRTLRQYQIRGWASVDVHGVHKGYVRGMLGWDDWNSGRNPSGRGDEDAEEVERAWYQFDLGQIHRNRTGQEPPLAFKIKVGRQYATIGTGLALAMPLDMIRMDLAASQWEMMALLGKTRRHSANLDSSANVATRQKRSFWGIEVKYTGLEGHRPFAYFLSNEDHTTPKPRDATQSYAYDSRYVGVGSTGNVLLPNLRYQVEAVGEWGKTYSEVVTSGRDRIEAMAVDAMLEYFFNAPTHPRVSVEYLWGSGDGNRRASSTSTVGGNQAGSPDHAFNAFGFRDTGLAFNPAVSNMHIYQIGASFFPFEQHKLLKKMEVGTKTFFYHKCSPNGAISDTTGTNTSRWVGWEWDVYCDWRITSDLSWTIRYGAFRPGAAFANNSCRRFLYTGVTLSF